MSDTLIHDGYVATVSLDLENQVLHGSVVNTRDILTFEAENLADLKAAFAATIADYKAWCAEEGVTPERPYSGNVTLRLPVETHRLAAVQATATGVSLNAWLVSTVECALDRRPLTMTQSDLDHHAAVIRDDVLKVVVKSVTQNKFDDLDELVWKDIPFSSTKTAIQ